MKRLMRRTKCNNPPHANYQTRDKHFYVRRNFPHRSQHHPSHVNALRSYQSRMPLLGLATLGVVLSTAPAGFGQSGDTNGTIEGVVTFQGDRKSTRLNSSH